MSNEAALIAAIQAAPNDHTLPLILADFFDENDDPRGQWIRNYRLREWMRPDYQSPVPKLLEALVKDHHVLAVRRAAAVIGEPIVPGLVELLKHERARVRQQACLCLRAIGPRAKAAVPHSSSACPMKTAPCAPRPPKRSRTSVRTHPRTPTN
jgi:uncharacterized protein (TIGR02996 family)